ncbi:TrbG [Neisseria zoodegmatis]|uniref:TrbG n=2 Tax=Neisseria zoodegmatis TaxID=326523 RepID=A0AB38DSY7_9NEIS|nr:TrbG [Neisseria zoodegmatis]
MMFLSSFVKRKFRSSENKQRNKNSYMTAFALSAWAVLFSSQAVADPRIRTENYSEKRVYTVYAKVGRAALVQLQDGEYLDSRSSALGMGDALAWKMSVRGNNILFKPSEAKPATNMIVVSDKRTYVFDLKIATAKQPPTYVLRFRYPEDIRRIREAQAGKRRTAMVALAAAGGVRPTGKSNVNYWGRGDKTLAPTALWDNGRFTYFRFDNGRVLPVIYRINNDGTESLADFHVEKDTVIVHETAAKFVLRSGKSVLGIENRSHDGTGTFNRTGTDDGASVRLLK